MKNREEHGEALRRCREAWRDVKEQEFREALEASPEEKMRLLNEFYRLGRRYGGRELESDREETREVARRWQLLRERWAEKTKT